MKHWHEGSFRDSEHSQRRPTQWFSEYRLLFEGGKGRAKVCARAHECFRSCGKIGNFPSFTVPVSKFIMHEVEKNSLAQTKWGNRS